MSYDPNQDANSGYGSPPYGVPPQGPYNQPPNPYGPPQGPYGPPPQGPYNQPQGPYGQPQSPYGYPPQGPYSVPLYQQPGYDYAAPPAAPLPLGEAIRQLPKQYVKVLTKPSAATFAEEMGKGNWGVVWIQLIGLAIIQAVSTSITDSIRNSISPNPQDPAYVLGQSIGRGIILVPLLFFIGQGLLYLLARAFGGQGIFRAQGYTTLLIYVPLTIISAALTLILIPARAFPPAALLAIALVLVIVALALLVYDIVLQTFAVMAVHRLSGGKAAAAVLISLGALLLLILCVSLIIVLAAAGARPH